MATTSQSVKGSLLSEAEVMKEIFDIASGEIYAEINKIKDNSRRNSRAMFYAGLEAGVRAMADTLFVRIRQACESAVIRYCEAEGVKFPDEWHYHEDFYKGVAFKKYSFVDNVVTLLDTYDFAKRSDSKISKTYISELSSCFYYLHKRVTADLIRMFYYQFEEEKNIKGMDDVYCHSGETMYHIISDAEGEIPDEVAWAIDDDSMSDFNHKIIWQIAYEAKKAAGMVKGDK